MRSSRISVSGCSVWQGAVLAFAMAAGLSHWVAAGVGPGSETFVLVSDRVNGVHRDLAADIAPVRLGPFTVQLTSPSNSLEILEHDLALRASAEGGDRAVLRVRYQGQARLVAELSMAGLPAELEDAIVLPRQETVVDGRVEIARQDNGYRVTTLELPSEVQVEIQSSLGGQLETFCRGFAVVAMGSIDCDALGEALSSVHLPLPEAGQSYFIEASRLTLEEQRQLEAYLSDR